MHHLLRYLFIPVLTIALSCADKDVDEDFGPQTELEGNWRTTNRYNIFYDASGNVIERRDYPGVQMQFKGNKVTTKYEGSPARTESFEIVENEGVTELRIGDRSNVGYGPTVFVIFEISGIGTSVITLKQDNTHFMLAYYEAPNGTKKSYYIKVLERQ